MDLLRRAETHDGYMAACAQSHINSLARRRCTYAPWPQQAQTHQPPGTQIVIMDPSAEGGMPHTRPPNIICIPAYYPESKLKETLAHELIHIDQRKNPARWEQRAENEGWKKVDDSAIPKDLRDRCRLNPDTFLSRFWAWEGRYVPLPIYKREDKPDLRDIAIRWYDLKEEIVQIVIPPSFTRKYGIKDTSAMEHPYELWAYA